MIAADNVPASTGATDHVPATAYLTAVARAEATADPAGGLQDPYAARFAAHCPPSILGVTRNTAGTSVVVARTVIIDRLLSDLLAHQDIDVCVNLGAGFDARPYRLNWPAGCRVIEVDSAPVLDVKDHLLPVTDAPVPVERLRCDLRDLTSLGRLLTPCTAGRRVVVVAEGLLVYFPEPHVTALAAALAQLGAAGSDWICDVTSVAAAHDLTAAAEAAGTPLELFGLPDTSAFETAGWRCEQLELLPTARLATGPPGRSSTAVSRRLPDSVLRLRATAADSPISQTT